MKVYSIGREVGCDIVINDPTDVISRRHAILNVMPSGKMTIVDQSHNGTYVNGIRIASNVPVPVTRKDNISFAHVARLDWNLIPNPQAVIMRWAIIATVAILLIVGGIVGYNLLNKEEPEPLVVTPDTTVVSRKEMEEKLRKKSEEIQQHIKDSLRRDSIRRDSIRKAQEANKTCPVCKKKISQCPYKGKHPVTKCKTCGKEVSKCPYKGKHPEKPSNGGNSSVGGRPQQ